jgi:MFS family permease
LENLRQPAVLGFLTVNLLLFLAHTTVFFFMKDFCLKMGEGDVGFFFTISSAVMIAVRLVGGRLLDRIEKRLGLFVSMGALALGFLCLSRLASPHLLYPLAAWYGLCVGVIMPLLNASMFLASRPDLRGLNSNLMLFMMDAGFFLAPIVGGAMLAMGYSVATLFLGCAGLCLVNMATLCVLMRLEAARC